MRIRPPTLKQKRFVKEYLKTANGAEAASRVYDVTKRTNAAAIAHITLQRPSTQAYMKKVLEEGGLTDEKISESLKQILDASLSERSLREATPQSGLEAIKLVAKLKDLFPAVKTQIDQRNLSLRLSSKSEPELKTMLDKVISEAEAFKKVVGKTQE